ncbi:MAG TPA: hypothetical protein VKT52_02710, partial [Ktedonobacterales bacterium]|nr:hypothetical protein [Ktedonobacterales bacterium]
CSGMRGESWRRGGRPNEHRERAGALSSRALRMALPLLASLALILVWGLASITLAKVPAARASGNATVAIIVPQPDSSGNARGPVGAYVSISAQNLNAQDTYVIGVGLSSVGCSAQFIPSGSQGVAPDTNGNLVTTIIWPSAANAVGSSYYICVQDHSQPGSPAIQSTDTYTVRAGNPPSISIAPAALPNGTPGPIPPQGSNSYYAGSQITITGQNYVPGGEPLAIHLLSRPPTDQNDILNAPTLPPTDNSTIVADPNGSFTTTVALPVPQTSLPAKFYVYVVSQDQQQFQGGTTYPSLIADKSITIVAQPSPTPTVTVAPTSTPAHTVTTTNNDNGPPNLGAVIGLGVTSALLFIIGVILLASAASMPRPRP